MSETQDLERAARLLERTAAILESLEAEVQRLATESANARARIDEWERAIAAVMPDEMDETVTVVPVDPPS